MSSERAVAAIGLAVCLVVAVFATVTLSDSETTNNSSTAELVDPLIQTEDHDHRNASQHVMFTDNIRAVSYNPLTAPGNAEIQVADSPDGKRYAYIAGWSEMHIVDVTNPENTTVTGVYYDPNTQVLDVKYLEYNAREYVIVQNQLVDPGAADPNVGSWEDLSLIHISEPTRPY